MRLTPPRHAQGRWPPGRAPPVQLRRSKPGKQCGACLAGCGPVRHGLRSRLGARRRL